MQQASWPQKLSGPHGDLEQGEFRIEHASWQVPKAWKENEKDHFPEDYAWSSEESVRTPQNAVWRNKEASESSLIHRRE